MNLAPPVESLLQTRQTVAAATDAMLAKCLAHSSATASRTLLRSGFTRHTFRATVPQNSPPKATFSRHAGLQYVNAISIGTKLPESTFSFFDAEKQMQEITTEELCSGKTVILFAVPGAFTPTCSLKHLPGFINMADELKSKGVDTIACISVNDAFVMDAWSQNVGAGDKIMMLADGSANFAKALGAELDLSDKGLGIRSRRYAMLVSDGVIKVLNMEEGGAFSVSSAEEMLKAVSS